MNDHDHPTTPAAPDDRPIVLLPDEAALLPAHLLAALTAPGPEGTADPDPKTREEMAAWARDDVTEAHAGLLGEIHDIDFHHYSDGGMDWLYSGQPVEQICADALHLAERVEQAAADARVTIAAAIARRDWLSSGRPLRCAGCGDVIGGGFGDWRVCRGAAEHDWCHDDNPKMEDDQRGCTVDEAEDEAYSEDRIRSGGPYPGDVVEVTYPGPTHPHPAVGAGQAVITAIWEADPAAPHGPGRARIDTSGGIWRPDGTTSPVPGHETPDLLDLTGAIGIRIIHTREDLQDDADPGDDPQPQPARRAVDELDVQEESLATWAGSPGDYDPDWEPRDDPRAGDR